MDGLRLHAHFSHSCFPVTLLDSRAVQGELGWVSNPTEGGVSAAKKCPLVRTHGPLLGKNREMISIVGRSCRVIRQIDTQPPLIRFCPGEHFMGISLLLYCVCVGVCVCLCASGLRIRSFHKKMNKLIFYLI